MRFKFSKVAGIKINHGFCVNTDNFIYKSLQLFSQKYVFPLLNLHDVLKFT